MLLLLTVGVGALVSVALIEAVHVGDTYQVTHVSGAWMALAKYADQGTLYPPLYDGHAYGGTRYMPLQILINAAASHATGEYLVSAKLVAYGLMALLLAVLFTVLTRHFELPTPLALASVAAVLVANALRFSATSIGADTLAVTLQLGAVVLIYSSRTRLITTTAALLCVLAFLSKVTAVWAPVAIMIWLASRDRRRLAEFAVSFLLPLGLSLGLLEAVTGGRFFANVFGLGTATLLPFQEAVVEAPKKFFLFLDASGPAISVIFPFALLGLGLAVAQRRVSVYHLSFGASFLVLLFVLTDRGAAYNQFIDVEVLSILVAADLVRQSALRTRGMSILGSAFAVALSWGIGLSFVVNLNGEFKDALRTVVGRTHAAYPTSPVEGYVSRNDRLLSQDPYVPVSLDALPVVLDAYMFRQITLDHPRWADQMARRLDARQFDKIVMFRHVGTHGELEPADPYWKTNHFGPAVVAAIVRNYRPLAKANGYWIYGRRR
jgi:hypothetical protein